ncbi:MAG: hypothetical protein IIA88_10530 [Bacteroidetes bacterium]|nr:hypothetical protein [Bacteroidota bacterium]
MKSQPILSKKELSIITNTEFLLTKVKVIEKIKAQFARVRDDLRPVINNSGFSFPPKVDTKMGKISRGEYYKQLPFVVLDYPALFTSKSVFAFRTMFWWGNFFSFTLHLQGKALQNYRQNIIRHTDSIKGNTFICTNSTPWEYYYKKDNYILMDEMPHAALLEILEKAPFIKLSRKIKLSEFNELNSFCRESLSNFLSVLG